MAKKFYTERDIDDLFAQGVTALDNGADVVLTELAFEKARRLGMKLGAEPLETPPSAPVRPYLSRFHNLPSGPGPVTAPLTPAVPAPAAALPASPPPTASSDLAQRIRSAVRSRLGDKIEPDVLETIIARVLKSTGLN